MWLQIGCSGTLWPTFPVLSGPDPPPPPTLPCIISGVLAAAAVPGESQHWKGEVLQGAASLHGRTADLDSGILLQGISNSAVLSLHMDVL